MNIVNLGVFASMLWVDKGGECATREGGRGKSEEDAGGNGDGQKHVARWEGDQGRKWEHHFRNHEGARQQGQARTRLGKTGQAAIRRCHSTSHSPSHHQVGLNTNMIIIFYYSIISHKFKNSYYMLTFTLLLYSFKI